MCQMVRNQLLGLSMIRVGGMTAADPLGDSAWSPMGFGGTYWFFGKVCEKDEVKIWGVVGGRRGRCEGGEKAMIAGGGGASSGTEDESTATTEVESEGVKHLSGEMEDK